MTRVAAEHTWPALKKAPDAVCRIAVSRSASANTTLGDLPPSSSPMRVILSAAARMMNWPVCGEPVNAILSMPRCETSAAPASAPKPGMILSTPGGNPASSAACPSHSADSGVSSAGLSTTVQPQAKAGAIFHTAFISGKFHGTIAATTPTGTRWI